MPETLTYKFEELELVEAPGFRAGLIDGQAEIEYRDETDWVVASISLDGFAEVRPAGYDFRNPPQVPVKNGSAIGKEIIARLYSQTWAARISDAIGSAMEDAGHVFPDPNDEHRLGVFETIGRAA